MSKRRELEICVRFSVEIDDGKIPGGMGIDDIITEFDTDGVVEFGVIGKDMKFVTLARASDSFDHYTESIEDLNEE